MLVRLRIHLIDTAGQPLAGARVVASPSAHATQEIVEGIRKSIELSRAEGSIAGESCAIGTTDAGGTVRLEYTLPGAPDGGTEWVTEGRFPFADYVRVDSVQCGTFFRELNCPRNVHFDLNPGPIGRGDLGEIERVAEADFEIRCDK